MENNQMPAGMNLPRLRDFMLPLDKGMHVYILYKTKDMPDYQDLSDENLTAVGMDIINNLYVVHADLTLVVEDDTSSPEPKCHPAMVIMASDEFELVAYPIGLEGGNEA